MKLSWKNKIYLNELVHLAHQSVIDQI